MKLVAIESPYGNADPKEIELNILYLRACMRKALLEGCAPFASHALYTQPGVFNDRDDAERYVGIEAGQCWADKAHERWIFTDRGVSEGMEYGIKRAKELGQYIRYLTLGKEWDRYLALSKHDDEAWEKSCVIQTTG